MADIFTPEKRSEIMSHIRSTGTAPERRMLGLLEEMVGVDSVEQHVPALPGRPDFVVGRLRVVIFVDGCFYHSCPQHGRVPSSNQEYWEPKLLRTRRRDASNRRQLRTSGWSVWRVWEHDLRGRRAETTALRLGRRLAKRAEALSA